MDTRADNRTVEVDRSVKVRRDSRKRSQPILANILLPLERVRCNSEYIGKTEFYVAVRHTQPHAQQPCSHSLYYVR